MSGYTFSPPRLAGLLFLFQLIPYFIAHEQIIGAHIYHSDFLTNFLDQRYDIHLAVVLELISGLAFIGFTVIICHYLAGPFPILSRFYFGVRLIELALLMLSNVEVLGLTALARQYAGNLQQVEELALGLRSLWVWTNLLLMIVFGTNALALYFMLLKTKVVPAFIAIWGLVAATLVIAAPLLFLFTNYNPPFIFYLPIGLNEFFLAFWLLIRGLKQ
jgi:hypothetical protein